MVLDQCMDILVFTGSSLKISVEHLQKYPDIFYGSICIDPVSQLHLLKQRPEAFLIKLVIFSAQGTDLFFQMSGRLKDRLKKKIGIIWVSFKKMLAGRKQIMYAFLHALPLAIAVFKAECHFFKTLFHTF